MEIYIDLGFMAFGLGFFLFVIQSVRNDEDKAYNRKLNEAREFGFETSRLRRQTRRFPFLK